MSAVQLTLLLIAFLAGMGAASVGIALWLYRRSRSPEMRVLPGSGLMMTVPKRTFWADFWHGVATEMAGAIVTAVLFTVILGAAEQQSFTEERKNALVLQLGSPDHGFAIEAARQLRAQGWLEDGALVEARLFGANLQEAFLWGANLQGAFLAQANLQEAILREANLQEADLWQANLQGASLLLANLKNAKLEGADLRGAVLWQTNLQGANLLKANLQGASLAQNQLDESVVLPDGDFLGINSDGNSIYTPDSYYQPGVTDMRKYTDPAHPEFWQPELGQPEWVEEANR